MQQTRQPRQSNVCHLCLTISTLAIVICMYITTIAILKDILNKMQPANGGGVASAAGHSTSPQLG